METGELLHLANYNMRACNARTFI